MPDAGSPRSGSGCWEQAWGRRAGRRHSPGPAGRAAWPGGTGGAPPAPRARAAAAWPAGAHPARVLQNSQQIIVLLTKGIRIFPLLQQTPTGTIALPQQVFHKGLLER